MGVGVKCDGVDLRHINFSIHYNALIGSDIDHLADDAASVFIVLILDESALQAEWKSAGINGCVKEIIMIQRRTPPAVCKNVRGMNAPITNNATIIPTGFSSGIVGFSWPDVLQNAVIRCIALLFQEKHFR